MVPGRPDEPRDGPRSDDRRVVRRAGPEADRELLDLQLADTRHELCGVAQQLVHASGRRARRGEAALLHRGAQHVTPIPARHQVAAVEANDRTQQACPCGIAKPQDLSLDRADRNAGALGQAPDALGPWPRRQHHPAAGHALTARQRHAADRVAVDIHPRHLYASSHYRL